MNRHAPQGESIRNKSHSDGRHYRLHVRMGWMRGKIQWRYAQGVGQPSDLLVAASRIELFKNSTARHFA
jgi:hypothetical protein